jgi:CspA family cold shock protein
MSNRIRGAVSRFDDTKGYGFIRRDDGNGRDVFVHQTAIVMSGFRTLTEGDAVEFDIEMTPKGAQATNVVKVDPSPIDDMELASRAWDDGVNYETADEE